MKPCSPVYPETLRPFLSISKLHHAMHRQSDGGRVETPISSFLPIVSISGTCIAGYYMIGNTWKAKAQEVSKMPRGDGTGPKGQGSGTGRGMGKDGGGQGRGGGFGAGPGGYCVCPSCGERAAHQMGSPCYEQQCPKCGKAMTRE